MDPNTEYKETGNKVPLPMDELINFAQEKLQDFDRLVEATQSRPERSPYNSPIIYTTKEGKLVQIPEYIQQQAVNLWSSAKKGLTQDLTNRFDRRNYQEEEELPPLSEDPEDYKKFEEGEHKDTEEGNTWKYVLCFIITILILISSYVMMNEKSLKFQINM